MTVVGRAVVVAVSVSVTVTGGIYGGVVVGCQYVDRPVVTSQNTAVSGFCPATTMVLQLGYAVFVLFVVRPDQRRAGEEEAGEREGEGTDHILHQL